MKNLLHGGRVALNLTASYLSSLYESRQMGRAFDDLRAYCMFVGYPRSGHSLIGSLLDAHPQMCIAHELDALKFVQARFDRHKIYTLLLNKSRQFTGQGRIWNGYSYRVPDQWQGRFQELRVIGDKKGGGSTQRLKAKPELLQRLRLTTKLPLRVIHVVRNPYDNISSISIKTKQHRRTLSEGIDFYFSLCETVTSLKSELEPSELLEFRHEDFVKEPRLMLNRICHFLGEEASPKYLDDCASLVFESPRASRHAASWNQAMRHRVADGIARHPFLAGYAFDV